MPQKISNQAGSGQFAEIETGVRRRRSLFRLPLARAAENNVYLALANWNGQAAGTRANGLSSIYPPTCTVFPWPEVTADEDEPGLMMMTIDTREQRTGRCTSRVLK